MDRKNRSLLSGCLAAILVMLMACAPLSSPSGSTADRGAKSDPAPAAASAPPSVQGLPVRFQSPSYLIKELDSEDPAGQEEEITMPVGADISSTSPMSLREVLKILAGLKKMTVSWASDVRQNSMVDVNIGADDDFFTAIDNLLRQVDYFHEVKGNTIVIRYNDTKKFHIAMPFMSSNYATSVGGNVLGKSTASNQISSEENSFDIWQNIEDNLNKVLEIYAATEAQEERAPAAAGEEGEDGEAAPAAAPPQQSSPSKGYYTIDKPIGLVTVTAPRPLLEKITAYFDNLKQELYRQISIEAKIIEVTLTDTSSTGIDWSDLLSGQSITVGLFNDTGQIYPRVHPTITTITGPSSFSLVLNAIETQGEARVLSNPRIVTMNGQPAMISVGQDMTYISEIEVTTDEGDVTTTVSTDSIFSGVGLGVVPMISETNEIILSLTPVISSLEGDEIEYKEFGTSGNESTIGLPVVNMREMNAVSRIKSGEMLVVGGFIKETESEDETSVPVLGKLPLVGNLFNSTSTSNPKTELVIMLRPTIM